MKSARDVATRCLSLELLAQRLGLEQDDEAAVEEREGARRAWAGRTRDLGAELTSAESALMEKSVGALTEDDLDDLDGRASAAPILLWALGRLSARPTFATDMGEALDEAGLLGDGSIAAAKKAVDEASLRDERAIGEGEAAYRKTRGMAKETDEPEKIFAEVAAHHLSWVLEDDAEWDSDD